MEDNNIRHNKIINQKGKDTNDMVVNRIPTNNTVANKPTQEKAVVNKAVVKDTNTEKIVAQQAECDQPVSHMVIEDTYIERLFEILINHQNQLISYQNEQLLISRYLKNIEDDKIKSQIDIQKFQNYYDVSYTIETATADNPDDPGSNIYQIVPIYQILERNADIIYVSNDGTSSLYTVISHRGAVSFSMEEEILPGEVKKFYNIREMRFRSPALIPYRVTEYEITKTTAAQFTPIEKGVIHNTALPAANADLFAAVLTPTNTPCTFRVQVAISVAGNINVTITRGGNTQTLTLNVVPGPALVADGLYNFDMLVHDGDTINYQYTATGGITRIFRVQEIDAAAT